jgi:hypothetical protein
MVKAKAFRLDDEVVEHIDWLAKALHMSATDVVRQAVEALYREKFNELLKVSYWEREDGGLDFYFQGAPIVSLQPKTAAAFRERGLLEKYASGALNASDVLLTALMIAAEQGEGLSMNDQTVDLANQLAAQGEAAA